ncbi:MAG TPA: methionine synthase [Armatimonadetes bacterium]|nr:methionine synthase [Armatimonadota bacterium]
MGKKGLVLGASLGECVHVAGVQAFLRLAEMQGYQSVFLGPAVPIRDLISAIQETAPAIVGVSYRLTPETAAPLLRQFVAAVEEAGLKGRCRFAFGGPEPVAQVARELGFFDAVFGGQERVEDVLAFLQGRKPMGKAEEDYPQTLLERLAWKSPYPLLRHHFGLPSLEATVAGIRRIAEARILDIISLGTDQDAQENFFHPERQAPRRKGAGGVPVRSADDFRRLYAASRCGNFPLMRTYAGTADLLRQAQVHLATINNCFCAVPLFWFSRLDGRGPLGVEERVRASQEVMRWYAARDVPVELNEPHHWSLRSAPDTVFVAAAFLSAYNAKQMGVRHYIAQYMFNSPAGVSFTMDLAKILASIDLVEELADDQFTVHRETRTGLLSYPVEAAAAKGQLASSTMLQMAVEPEIVHVVAYCEADHAATAEEVIESCGLVRQVIENALQGQPDLTLDPAVQARREELKREARLLLKALQDLGPEAEDPWTDPATLARAVRWGFLDAPELRPSEEAWGRIQTRVLDGACRAVDEAGHPLAEEKRLAQLWREVSQR